MIFLNDRFQVWFRIFVGCLIFYAGASKVMDTPAFAADIMSYGLTGYKTSVMIASVLPSIEIFAGFLLIIGFHKKAAMAVVILLMAVFTFAIVYALSRGLDIGCGCFSDSFESNLWFSLFRNVFIFCLACVSFHKMEIIDARSI
jgi:putative oxidoreductase